jgi:hypothetical protein
MATTLKTVVTARIDATYQNIIDLVTADAPLQTQKKITMTNGTAADRADLVFSDTRTISASSSENLDLAASLTDVFGSTLTFVELRAIMVIADSSNTNNVRVTRPASNGVPLFLAASDGIDVPPGGVFLWSCPADGAVTVTASTGDIITVANSSSGTAVNYDIVIVGTSA